MQLKMLVFLRWISFYAGHQADFFGVYFTELPTFPERNQQNNRLSRSTMPLNLDFFGIA